MAACLAAVVMVFSPSRGDPGGHVVVDDRLFLVLERAGPALFVSEQLVVDATHDRRLVVPNKCEGAGEIELIRLARTAELEEAFAFVPSLCTWIDIGVDQTASSVRVERRLVDDIVAAFRSIVVYHIHPIARDGAVTYFPAYSDLVGLVLINSRYLDDRTVEIRHRATTPDGTIEYSFLPSGKAKQMIHVIFSTGLARYAGENLSLAYAGAEQQNEYHAAVRQCAALSARAARPLSTCFPMQAGDFVLDYREHGERVGAEPDTPAEP